MARDRDDADRLVASRAEPDHAESARAELDSIAHWVAARLEDRDDAAAWSAARAAERAVGTASADSGQPPGPVIARRFAAAHRRLAARAEEPDSAQMPDLATVWAAVDACEPPPAPAVLAPALRAPARRPRLAAIRRWFARQPSTARDAWGHPASTPASAAEVRRRPC